ncbi:MAG: ribulose-phosphate 3-epimerase [Chlorobi bacterium]|nr:ribulose-phosphate 3-epimerase [Chlorobiota bacterium]
MNSNAKPRSVIVSPSVLSANFACLERDIKEVEPFVEWLHLDVMDGVFVPNISFGIPVVKAIRKATDLFLDVHLMIVQPERYINQFAEAGADLIYVHVEATPHIHRAIQQIKSLGIKAGVALNPGTPLEQTYEVLPFVDIVLIMSVNPGFGGQKFIPTSLSKINRLRELIDREGHNVLIAVDGGVNIENAGELVKAGTDVLIAGSAIFQDRIPIREAVRQMCENALS